MPIDYKYRAEDRSSNRRRRKSGRSSGGFAVWRWMLITSLVIGFVVFLFYIRTEGHKQVKELPLPPFVPQNTEPAPAATQGADSKTDTANKQAAIKQEAPAKSEPAAPHFDFYTILPEKETVVPDHEIATRTREEQVGSARATRYIVQAGSFRSFKEADRLRAKLALMGIESHIEKAKVKDATWYRIKLGPYSRMSSVGIIRSRLRKNGIDVVVIEQGR